MLQSAMAGAGSGMPTSSMSDAGTEMPTSSMTGGVDTSGSGAMEKVLVELRVPRGQRGQQLLSAALSVGVPGFQVDADYAPVPLSAHPELAADLAAAGEETVIIRGTVDAGKSAELEAQPNVVRVYKDTPIAPFTIAPTASIAAPDTAFPNVRQLQMAAPCAIPPCDCDPGTAKGAIADVAKYLGVDQIWAAGLRGEGIVVGVVDGGITALGRPPKSGETAQIPNVIGGFPTADWGTTATAWSNHGNMTSTDVLGMAPNARIFDIRISDGGTTTATISNAIAGFQWAINQRAITGTPHILSNSWGIFQQSWDPVYATDATHPFTRKVVDALDAGILVLFAAGNCGATCPDGRCGSDAGPGKDIWGANGHPRVMTVGAVNKDEQYVGYSSAGPAALDAKKPDFCSITHFKGYFASDSGTSAATPIAAGVVALLKQSNPALTQDQAKGGLTSTAKDIGTPGWDQYAGAGIIRAKAAFDQVGSRPQTSGPVVTWGANRLDAFVVGTDSALYHKYWNGSAWGPSLTTYEFMGGTLASDPEVVAWGPTRLDAFVLGTDSALYHKYWNGSAWGPSLTGYEFMGGTLVGQPKVVAWGPNRLDAFAVGTDSALYHKYWNGAAWGPSLTTYEFMGGTITSDPEAVAWGPNRLDVFVRGTDGALYHKWWNGSAWGPSLTAYEFMGGTIVGQPQAVAWGPNRLDVFVVGTNRALYHKWWNGSAWGPASGFELMGGTILGQPRVVSWGPNRLDVFVVGTNHALYHKWWDGTAWGPSLTSYEYMGGTIVGQPRVVSWGPNRLDVFVQGTNHALYHKWWNGTAWGPSLTGYEFMGGTISGFTPQLGQRVESEALVEALVR
jgi:serine protease AprX